MNSGVVNIKEKLGKFNELWSPKIVCSLNDYHIKLVKVKGDFVWHKHEETDELFFVIAGELIIELNGDEVKLHEGEMFVVPKGTEHKPYSPKGCELMVIEPAETINTGDAGGEMTKPELEWI